MAACNSAGGSGWPGAITTYILPDGSPSKNVVIRNNYVHDAWGECIIALFADGITIEGNRLRDCYGVSLYVDTSKNVRIERNQIWTTTDKYDKNSGRASGITFASEGYSTTAPKQAVENLVIANNLITQTGMGISRWQDPANTLPHNTWKDVHILHNVIKGATKVSLYNGVGRLAACALRRHRDEQRDLEAHGRRRGLRGRECVAGGHAVQHSSPRGTPRTRSWIP